MRFSFEESSREEPHSAQSTRHSAQSASYASPDPFTPWTLQQSFFAVCGGLAVDTSSFWHTPLTTLTPRGLLALAHAGLLPNITNEQVSEKSKANAAAKVLVCIQASWFLVQAVARLAQKLPLTLLEVHVLTHVLCALAMYFCWVDKPYDAETPVVVTDEQVKDLVSLFVLDAGGTESVQDRLMRPISMDEIRQRHKPRQWIKDPSVKVPRFRFKLDWPSDQDDDDGESKEVFDEESIQVECETPTSQELARMRDHHIRANRALDYLRNRYFQAVACRGDGEMPPEPQLYFEQSWSSAKCKYVVYERSNRKIEGGFGKSDSVFGRFDKAFSVVSALYGAMHLAAWNDHFPSAVECWMWRVGALCMVVAPPLWQATNLVDLLLNGTRVEPKEKWVRAAWLFWLAKVARWLLVALVAGPMLLVGYAALIGWSYGRLFMLVEGFISLRSPPVGTYEVLGWSNYWPHAG